MTYFDRVQTFALFVSPARSGHSIIGQLLTAHPDVLIADELGAVTRVREGYSADQVYAQIRAQDLHHQARGRAKSGYDYLVHNAWQNVADKHPLVIGDAKGARTTGYLARYPEFADQLREAVGVPLRFIVHLRDPFDMVGSRVKRRGKALDDAIRLVRNIHDQTVIALSRLREDERLIQYHEDVIANPADAFRRMFEFLGVDPNPQVIEACAAKVWRKPHAARAAADWPKRQTQRVHDMIAQSPVLGRYAQPPRAIAAVPASPATPITPRPRHDDRSSYFDRLKTFCILASPSSRGVGRFALNLSSHPDVVMADEIVTGEITDANDTPDTGPTPPPSDLLDDYTAPQLYALIKQQHYRHCFRESRRAGSEVRANRIYKAVLDKRPTVIGSAPGLLTIQALSTQDHALDRLRDTLNLPLRVIFYFPLLRKAERQARAREAASWREANVHTMTQDLYALRDRLADDEHLTVAYDQLQQDPEDVFQKIYDFLGVPHQPDVVNHCAATFRKHPRAYIAKVPWWLKQARNLKQSLKNRGLIDAK
ncbi:MAG: sulfotransferase [Planctomycetota bacterium]